MNVEKAKLIHTQASAAALAATAARVQAEVRTDQRGRSGFADGGEAARAELKRALDTERGAGESLEVAAANLLAVRRATEIEEATAARAQRARDRAAGLVPDVTSARRAHAAAVAASSAEDARLAAARAELAAAQEKIARLDPEGPGLGKASASLTEAEARVRVCGLRVASAKTAENVAATKLAETENFDAVADFDAAADAAFAAAEAFQRAASAARLQLGASLDEFVAALLTANAQLWRLPPEVRESRSASGGHPLGALFVGCAGFDPLVAAGIVLRDRT